VIAPFRPSTIDQRVAVDHDQVMGSDDGALVADADPDRRWEAVRALAP
jgi:hypothetical protein